MSEATWCFELHTDFSFTVFIFPVVGWYGWGEGKVLKSSLWKMGWSINCFDLWLHLSPVCSSHFQPPALVQTKRSVIRIRVEWRNASDMRGAGDLQKHPRKARYQDTPCVSWARDTPHAFLSRRQSQGSGSGQWSSYFVFRARAGDYCFGIVIMTYSVIIPRWRGLKKPGKRAIVALSRKW
jgi:hypothetical protein